MKNVLDVCYIKLYNIPYLPCKRARTRLGQLRVVGQKNNNERRLKGYDKVICLQNGLA